MSEALNTKGILDALAAALREAEQSECNLDVAAAEGEAKARASWHDGKTLNHVDEKQLKLMEDRAMASVRALIEAVIEMRGTSVDDIIAGMLDRHATICGPEAARIVRESARETVALGWPGGGVN